MRPAKATPAPATISIVTAQIGRTPRGEWWVEATCEHGYPQVVGTPPVLEDSTPFPTLYWLSCPWLCEQAGAEESQGGAAQSAERLATEPQLAERMRRADAQYRARRAYAAGDEGDACANVGIAGLRDPVATKCLHAHLATALAGIDDPIGTELLARFGRSCPDVRCESLAPGEDVS